MSARDLFWRHGSAPAALEPTPINSSLGDASSANTLAALAASAADPSAGPNVKALFSSPSEGRPKQAPAKKRVPARKRLSQGYIPRPQNPFMLFRAHFIKQKHIPGSVETNQSLSKIIGIKWRSLTPEEKNVWEIKAEHEKAAHKIRFPEYRFRPIHNKGRKSQAATFDDDAGRKSNKGGDQRTDEAGGRLLEGARAGEMQSMAIRHHPSYTGMVTRHRRSSSAPQPSGRFEYPKNRVITLPTLPAIISRPSSPSSVPSISRFRQSHKNLLNAPQHYAHGQLASSSLEPAGHSYGSQLPQAIAYSGQSMSKAFTPAAYGAHQANLGLGEHRRSLSSQSQDYSFLAPNSWTMPTMKQNDFMPMSASTTSFTPTSFDSDMAQANVEEDQSLPEVDLEFFSDFSFNEDIYGLNSEDQNYSPESESSASASPPPLLNDQCIDGTVNPAALRLPAFSGLTPIDTSVHALSRSSSLESEPFSSISLQSTPMMTPSSSFPSSPAPSPSSISSDAVDIDFSNLFNVECFDASYSYDVAFSTPPALYEDDGMFGYGFDADNATISSSRLFEEGSIGSKMMDMTTPTQAMFGMEST